MDTQLRRAATLVLLALVGALGFVFGATSTDARRAAGAGAGETTDAPASTSPSTAALSIILSCLEVVPLGTGHLDVRACALTRPGAVVTWYARDCDSRPGSQPPEAAKIGERAADDLGRSELAYHVISRVPGCAIAGLYAVARDRDQIAIAQAFLLFSA